MRQVARGENKKKKIPEMTKKCEKKNSNEFA